MRSIALSILSLQCLKRRFCSAADRDPAVPTRQTERNRRRAGINWRFTTTDAGTTLKSLSPLPDMERQIEQYVADESIGVA